MTEPGASSRPGRCRLRFQFRQPYTTTPCTLRPDCLYVWQRIRPHNSKSMISASASAPGKLILFGEHAVVHGATAVAAALSDLRAFVDVVSITPSYGVLALCLDLRSGKDTCLALLLVCCAQKLTDDGKLSVTIPDLKHASKSTTAPPGTDGNCPTFDASWPIDEVYRVVVPSLPTPQSPQAAVRPTDATRAALDTLAATINDARVQPAMPCVFLACGILNDVLF